MDHREQLAEVGARLEKSVAATVAALPDPVCADELYEIFELAVEPLAISVLDSEVENFPEGMLEAYLHGYLAGWLCGLGYGRP